MDPGERQDALARALAGDAQARGDLLESYRPYLRVIARSFHDARLQARFDESDVVQDGMLAAHRAFESFRGRTVAELVAWLREIVIRSAGHIHRDNLTVEKGVPRSPVHAVQSWHDLSGRSAVRQGH